MHPPRSAREPSTCLLRLQADIRFIWRSDSSMRIFESMHCLNVRVTHPIGATWEEKKRNWDLLRPLSSTSEFYLLSHIWYRAISASSSECGRMKRTEWWRVSSRTIGSLFTTFVSVHAGQDGPSCGEEARRWESIFRDNHCGSRINVTVYGREDILQVETPPAIVALKTAPAVEWPLSESVYRVTVTWTLWFFFPSWLFDFTDEGSVNTDYKKTHFPCMFFNLCHSVTTRKCCGFAPWHFLHLKGGLTQNEIKIKRLKYVMTLKAKVYQESLNSFAEGIK